MGFGLPGVEAAWPVQGDGEGGGGGEVAAGLGVSHLHGRRHVAVAQQHRPLRALHPHILAQTAPATTIRLLLSSTFAEFYSARRSAY